MHANTLSEVGSTYRDGRVHVAVKLMTVNRKEKEGLTDECLWMEVDSEYMSTKWRERLADKCLKGDGL